MKPEQARHALEALTRPFAPVAEHRTLMRLLGVWQVHGEWHVLPGQTPVAFTARMINTGILGGHYVESRTLYDDQEGSRVIYGFDPDEQRFIAFAINAITSRSDVEYGRYEQSADALFFEGVEPVGPKRRPMRFERVLRYIADDELHLEILHPEMEEGKQLGMALRLMRLEGLTA